MFKGNIIYGKDINIYLGGSAYHYFMYSANHPTYTGLKKHSFLIPRTHFELFKKDLENFDIEVYFKIEDVDTKWYKLTCLYTTLYESVYRHEDYFEFTVNGQSVLMNESDMRDLKIKTILYNEI